MPDTLTTISFAKLEPKKDMPHLLDIQTRAFEALLQTDAAANEREDIGLERVFKDLFPIADVHENFSLEFVRYSLGEPKYSVEECIERDMTYSAPLKATLQLVINEVVGEVKRPRNIIEKEVYLGELPLLTPLGTFVINGAERVIVSQLHRSPGVVFEEATHPNGQRLISARIIPFRGSWVEFTVDIHDVIYVHIDKKKKFPATALLRAFGYGDELVTSCACSSASASWTSPRSARAAPTSARYSARSSPRTSSCRAKPRRPMPRRRAPRNCAPNVSAPRTCCWSRKATNSPTRCSTACAARASTPSRSSRRTSRWTCATRWTPSSAASARCAARSQWTSWTPRAERCSPSPARRSPTR